MTPTQPYEGITRIPAADFPFELDDSMLPLKMMIRILARELNSACLAHGGSRYRDMYKDMEEPRPGDLVIEQSTSYWHKLDCTVGGFGILLAKRREWETTDEEYTAWCARRDEEDRAADITPSTPEEHARDRMQETAWYVQYGPDHKNVYRWVNARCVKLPVTLAELAEAKKVWP